VQNWLLFIFGGKALQKGTGLIQFVLNEAINFLGEAQPLPKVNKSRKIGPSFG
jgi:hypothetical protein